MEKCKTNVKVKLIGENGNAYNIIGKVIKALKEGGHADLISEYKYEAMSGDYDHLLQTTMKFVIVE